jgi:hypothetical protein
VQYVIATGFAYAFSLAFAGSSGIKADSVRLLAVVAAGVALLFLLCLTGCGFETTNQIAALQLPPGALCSSQFYKTATLEEVKQEIGSRSLAEMKYVEKTVSRSSMGIFPSYSVKRNHINPLDAALEGRTSPEVFALLLEAGAGQREARERKEHRRTFRHSDGYGYITEMVYAYLISVRNDAEAFRLLQPWLPQDACERFLG